MARQSFFRSPAPQTESKYGSAVANNALSGKMKILLLVAALLVGSGLGSAYAFVFANDLNRTAREKLKPGAEDKAKRQKALAAAKKRAEEMERQKAELEAARKKELAEKLAQVNPLKGLFGSTDTGDKGTTTAQASEEERPTRPRPRATPKGKELKLDDVAAEARKMLQQTQ